MSGAERTDDREWVHRWHEGYALALRAGYRGNGAKARAEAWANVPFRVEDIEAIRRAVDEGVPRWQIAERYGVAQSTIKRIGRRQTWTWVGEDTPPLTLF